MNDLQRTELEMLKEFIKICNNNSLEYFLVGGSALGAVKYGGFIPWDDDIDIAMPRSDYEKFCELAKEELPEFYFLQNSRSDKYYPLLFSKIRDCRSTYIESALSGLPINHGIFIDLFPLDRYPADKRKIERLEREKRRYFLSRLCTLKGNMSKKAELLAKLQRLFGLHKRGASYVRRVEKYIIINDSLRVSNTVCSHGGRLGKREYTDASVYGNGYFCFFEGIRVRIPEKYAEYLSQRYGDYTLTPPESEKRGHHFYTILDTEKPYTEYTDRKLKKRRRKGDKG